MNKIASFDEVLKNKLNRILEQILNGAQKFLESPFQNKDSKWLLYIKPHIRGVFCLWEDG